MVSEEQLAIVLRYIEIGKAIEATISPTKDQDWYRVEVPERGLLHVVIDPVPEDLIPALILHGEDGKEIGRWQGRCRRRLEAHREIGEAATLYLLVVNGPLDEGENGSRTDIPFCLRGGSEAEATF